MKLLLLKLLPGTDRKFLTLYRSASTMSDIKAGFWQDHDFRGSQCEHYVSLSAIVDITIAYQYLIPEKRANLISNAIAVTLTLALPRVYILFKRSIPSLLNFLNWIVQLEFLSWLRQASSSIFEKIHGRLGRTSSSTLSVETPVELNAASYPDEDRERRILTGTLATIQGSTTTEDAVSQLARRHLAMPRLTIGDDALHPHSLRRTFENIAMEPGASGYILLFMFLLFAIYIGIQVIAVSSSFIIGGSAATIKSGACAYYVTGNWTNDWEIISFSAHHRHQSSLTELALTYAEACYQSTESTTPCPMAATRSIIHNTSTSSSCPFPNESMCKFGNKSVFAMDSGFVQASRLGINSARRFEFRRRTTCSPVLDNETFVDSHNVSENVVEIRYLYQDNPEHRDSLYTFRERRHLDYNKLLDQFSGINHLSPDMFLNKAYDVQ